MAKAEHGSVVKASRLLLLVSTACAAQQAIELGPLGTPRQLPDRILGANVNPFYERLMEDPAKIRLLKTMDIGYVRFPGGTNGQFWQPETGKLAVPPSANPSSYRRFWAGIAPRLNQLHPNGISVAEDQQFLDKIGAAMILVPNLDTSSLEAQRAWFQKLAEQKLVPDHIEMGNESYLAMINDPLSLQRFPDERAYSQLTRQYLNAFQPFLPAGTKIAIQAAPVGFSGPDVNRGLLGRFHDWNQALRPEPWFQAVTVHLYARLSGSETHLFEEIMGRFDSGVDRIINSIVRQVPGKEIWVTEWNPRGGDPSALNKADPRTAGMMMHAASRTVFALLRHPEVTISQYFMLNFDTQNAFTVFVKQGDAYRTTPPSEAMSWFNNAANGGATFQEYAWGDKTQEGFTPVVAGLFAKGNGVTLIVQNAAPKPYRIELKPFYATAPDRVERMLPDLSRGGLYAAEVETVQAGGELLLPPLSLTRVHWAR